MTLTHVLFFLIALVVGVLLHNYLFARASRYKIKKANQSAIRWGSQTKPVLGGITFYVVFLLSLGAYTIFFDADSLLDGPFLGAVLVLNLAFLMGLADDMLNTPPGFKFVVQLLGALILIAFDLYIDLFQNDVWNYLLTVFWFVGIMNSINMLDNMDAITTSVGISILLGALTIVLVLGNGSSALTFVGLALLAGLLSFLTVNWHPAKMYMGDNGSQFLGALLAIVGIEVFWNGSVQGTAHPYLYPFALIFMAFIVPITDTTTVTINRLMRGQSPFIGGRDHTTHHLSYLGLKDRKIAFVLFTINLLGVATASFLLLYPEKVSLPIWSICLVFVLIFVLLYWNTKRSKPPQAS